MIKTPQILQQRYAQDALGRKERQFTLWGGLGGSQESVQGVTSGTNIKEGMAWERRKIAFHIERAAQAKSRCLIKLKSQGCRECPDWTLSF